MNASITCKDYPCSDVRHERFTMPGIELDPALIRGLLISESSAQQANDDYYAGEQALFAQTTLLAFNDAGFAVKSIQEVLSLGVYLTTAIKCAKTTYGIKSATVRSCSYLLEQEMYQFPNLKMILLMGDVAIKSINFIAQRQALPRPVPAGSTYKIRGNEFYFHSMRVFPSYLQAGPSFFIEKSKRKMIAEDIRSALYLIA